MQTGSGLLLHAQHEVWSLLLGSSVDSNDIQMSASGTLLRLGEVVLFPAILHLTRGRQAGMPGPSHKQFCMLLLTREKTEEENACWYDFSDSQYQYCKNIKSSKCGGGSGAFLSSHHLPLSSLKYENPA